MNRTENIIGVLKSSFWIIVSKINYSIIIHKFLPRGETNEKQLNKSWGLCFTNNLTKEQA